MTNAYNPHASCRNNGQAAYLIEKKLIRWMCGLAGYPEGSGGLFVSGGSIANLTALTAARDAKLTFKERAHAVVYVSEQTHASVSKGLHIIGFSRDQIRMVPTDSAFCMELSALRAAIGKDMEKGKRPFAVIASAGTTNTGSVDPLTEISGICREFDMWMHVDGAFGASVLLSERYRKHLSGIECSDSLSWDAHKWLMQTYGCSVVLVRNRSDLVRSFAAHPEWEIVSPAQMGIVNFRYVSDRRMGEQDLDMVNQAIAREITESGFAQIFTTELRGKTVLRMCTINPETTEKDICDTIERLTNSRAIREWRKL